MSKNDLGVSSQLDSVQSGSKGAGMLKQFAQQANSLTDPSALVELIQQALANPHVHVFGELLDLPVVQQLQNGSHEPWLQLLRVFAYGKYSDYDESKHPPLTDVMRRKLQYLTIVSLASQNRKLPYHLLLEELRLDNLRTLEDLIIEAIYANLIQGKLDQRQRCLEVESALSRDVRVQQLDTIVSVLGEWLSNCDGVLSSIEQQIGHANEIKEENVRGHQELESCIASLRKNIKTTPQELDEMWEQVGAYSPPSNTRDYYSMKRQPKTGPLKLKNSGGKFWGK